jgi:hypothetical protein
VLVNVIWPFEGNSFIYIEYCMGGLTCFAQRRFGAIVAISAHYRIKPKRSVGLAQCQAKGERREISSTSVLLQKCVN